MAKEIERYNASYPAAFYEIGTVYSFYANVMSKGDPAPQEYIGRYSTVLKALESQQKSNVIQSKNGGSLKTSGGKGFLSRYYAVVVAKTATFIEVMFLNEDNGSVSYLMRKYVVGKSCDTDEKDLMMPSVRTHVSGVQGGTSNIGGITRIQDADNGKVGGITRAYSDSTTFAQVGRITRMREKTSSIDDTSPKTNRPEPKVGGITRSRK